MNTTRWSKYLHEPFVYAALGIALTAGFGYGATTVLARAFGLTPGTWYSALVQAHGHAQLFGWVGLMLLGVGMYFLPKLRGATLKGVSRAPAAWALLVAGISLRSIVQPLAGLGGGNGVLRGLLLVAAVLELAGMLLIVSMLGESLGSAKPLPPDAPAYPIELFAQCAFLSLALAFLVNLFGAWNMLSEGKSLLAVRYDQLTVNLVAYGAVIPMTFVFAVRTLPLFLRRVVPGRGIWRPLALAYFVGVTLCLTPNFIAIADDVVILSGRLLRANLINMLVVDGVAALGAVLMNVCLLIGIWQLNLTRRRGDLPDQGEYGRFDLLIYSAYAWLVAAALMDLVRVLPVVNEMVLMPLDAARHALTLGFITLLIFGMAVRMLPGFSGKRALAHSPLVVWTFLLGNSAAFLRVAPLLLPGFEGATWLVALSGVLGWTAVLLLAIMLVGTFRQK